MLTPARRSRVRKHDPHWHKESVMKRLSASVGAIGLAGLAVLGVPALRTQHHPASAANQLDSVGFRCAATP